MTMKERLTKALDLFFNSREDIPPMGVEVTDVSDDDKSISVTLTLLRGFRYCCGEPECHVGLSRRQRFARLIIP